MVNCRKVTYNYIMKKVKGDIMKKKNKLFTALGIGAVLGYAGAAVLPFVKQKTVSASHKKKNLSEKINLPLSEKKQWARILPDNDEAREQKLRAIRQAKDRIILTTYRFITDRTGKAFMAELLAAAQRGVKVDILVDGCTLLASIGKDHYFHALQDHENIEFNVYNPIKVHKPWTINGRMHDKYLIVDDYLVLTGGRNVADRFNITEGGEVNYDWDVMIYTENRFEGDFISQIESYFQSVKNSPATENIMACTIKSTSASRYLAVHDLQDYLDDAREKRVDYKAISQPVDNVTLLHNPITPYAKEPHVFYDLTELMKASDEDIYFHTPYYIPNQVMKNQLSLIASQKPTYMLLNSVANARNVFGAVELLIDRKSLLETGIHLMELQNTNAYHGKIMTVSDDISAIGGFNWDMRSMYINTELMAVVKGKDFQAEVRKAMQVYEDQTVKVVSQDIQIPPAGQEVQKENVLVIILYYIIGFLTRPIRFLL